MSTLREIQSELWRLKDALQAVKNDPLFGALLDSTRSDVLASCPEDDDEQG